MALPPGPRAPYLVQAIQFKARPLAYLDACAERYGDIFTAGGDGSSPTVYVSDPSAIQEILAAGQDLFAPFRDDEAARFLFGERSIVYREGDGHQRERRLLTPPLHGERLRANAATITGITDGVIDNWRAGEPFVVAPAMRDITLRIIFRILFGADEGERLQRLRHLFASLMTSLNSPWRGILFRLSARVPLPLGRRSVVKTKGEIDRLIYEEIRERRARGHAAGADILSVLMSSQDVTGSQATDEELHDEVMTLLFAGHETTASALAWALYRLHHSPDACEELRRELETRAVRTEPIEISRLPYLGAVCQETLRLNPPCMSVLRVLKAPLQVARYRFAAGTNLIVSIYLTHRRADLYPRPEHFEPERFLGRQFSLYEYLPFGGGHRVCLGMSLALFEMKLVLATVLSRWQLAPADRGAVRHRRRMLTAGPRGNMRLVPIRACTAQGNGASQDLVPAP